MIKFKIGRSKELVCIKIFFIIILFIIITSIFLLSFNLIGNSTRECIITAVLNMFCVILFLYILFTDKELIVYTTLNSDKIELKIFSKQLQEYDLKNVKTTYAIWLFEGKLPFPCIIIGEQKLHEGIFTVNTGYKKGEKFFIIVLNEKRLLQFLKFYSKTINIPSELSIYLRNNRKRKSFLKLQEIIEAHNRSVDEKI